MAQYDQENLVIVFHMLGMSQEDILRALAHHGFVISKRHLRRILKNQNLYRRKEYSDIEEVALFIEHELSSSGRLHGYRWMYYKCLEKGLRVRKEDVRLILSCLDPDGSAFR